MIRKWIRRFVLTFLGVQGILDRYNERISDIEHHFVLQRNPQTGEIVETLADRTAKEDGRELPTKKAPHSRSWDQRKRQLEAETSQPRPRKKMAAA